MKKEGRLCHQDSEAKDRKVPPLNFDLERKSEDGVQKTTFDPCMTVITADADMKEGMFGEDISAIKLFDQPSSGASIK